MDQIPQQTPAQTNPYANTIQQVARPPVSNPTSITTPPINSAGMQVTNVSGQPGTDKKLWLWIIIAIIIVGAGVIAYFLI